MARDRDGGDGEGVVGVRRQQRKECESYWTSTDGMVAWFEFADLSAF